MLLRPVGALLCLEEFALFWGQGGRAPGGVCATGMAPHSQTWATAHCLRQVPTRRLAPTQARPHAGLPPRGLAPTQARPHAGSPPAYDGIVLFQSAGVGATSRELGNVAKPGGGCSPVIDGIAGLSPATNSVVVQQGAIVFGERGAFQLDKVAGGDVRGDGGLALPVVPAPQEKGGDRQFTRLDPGLQRR